MAELNRTSLQDQASALLERAEEKGLQTNFFFRTTFKRYQVQMAILSDLEKRIKEDGTTVAKEYVKGRANLYANPAVSEYNKTTVAANGTVATLINILRAFADESGGGQSKLSRLFAELNDE